MLEKLELMLKFLFTFQCVSIKVIKEREIQTEVQKIYISMCFY